MRKHIYPADRRSSKPVRALVREAKAYVANVKVEYWSSE
jgi:hypothetical protein